MRPNPTKIGSVMGSRERVLHFCYNCIDFSLSVSHLQHQTGLDPVPKHNAANATKLVASRWKLKRLPKERAISSILVVLAWEGEVSI